MMTSDRKSGVWRRNLQCWFPLTKKRKHSPWRGHALRSKSRLVIFCRVTTIFSRGK